jgi:AraC-like DNA-binding protein
VSLEGSLLSTLLTSLNLDSANLITLRDPARVETLFLRAEELLTEPPADFAIAGALLGCELLFTLATEFKPDKMPAELSKIIRYLERSMAKQISIGTLSREFNMSSATLHRLFKRHLEDSPINYLLKLRMAAAQKRLDFSRESIKMVAFQVGYSNPLYFSTEFRRLVGESPRSYRQRKNH